jgi:hypothetical protein
VLGRKQKLCVLYLDDAANKGLYNISGNVTLVSLVALFSERCKPNLSFLLDFLAVSVISFTHL